MRRLSVGIIDVLARSEGKSLYARAMRANLAAIMPQAIAVWCEYEGHRVSIAYYNGPENMVEELPDDLDIVFIGAFTQSAQLAYALSNYYRSKKAVTVLGGPHARSYPQDALKYFDYVLGFTDRTVIQEVLSDCAPYRPTGRYLSAMRQPDTLPGIEERWKYIDRLLKEAPFIRIVPAIGSLGCPYTCSFCVDATVPYQPLDFDLIAKDLRFLLKKEKNPIIGWHDPNFGVRFDDHLSAIEEAVPPGSIRFIAESSLSLLSESKVERLRRNGFKAALPGIESWFDMGYKSKTGKKQGLEKVARVAEQVNMVMEKIPYLQANFVLGLDSDEGPEPFELTKQFLDLCPGAFPAYSLLTAFGQSAPLNIEYQRAGRVIAVPFHFLNNNSAMNVVPKNYSWPEFYDLAIDLLTYSFSRSAIYRRLKKNRGSVPRSMNLLRAVSSEGWGKIKYFQAVRRRLAEDRQFRAYFEQETTELPPVFVEQIRRDLGPYWDWLPEGAIYHEPNVSLGQQQDNIQIINMLE